jgi:hypothetical protein
VSLPGTRPRSVSSREVGLRVQAQAPTAGVVTPPTELHYAA